MSFLWFDFSLNTEKEFKERLPSLGCVFGRPLSLAGRAALAVLSLSVRAIFIPQELWACVFVL